MRLIAPAAVALSMLEAFAPRKPKMPMMTATEPEPAELGDPDGAPGQEQAPAGSRNQQQHHARGAGEHAGSLAGAKQCIGRGHPPAAEQRDQNCHHIGHAGSLRRRNWPQRAEHASGGRSSVAGYARPAGRARRVARPSGPWGLLVEADIHPHVAQAVRRHRLLPHVALVIGVVVRLVDVRKAEVDDRPAEAMVPPGVSLDVPHAAAVKVNLGLASVAVVEVDLTSRAARSS